MFFRRFWRSCFVLFIISSKYSEWSIAEVVFSVHVLCIELYIDSSLTFFYQSDEKNRHCGDFFGITHFFSFLPIFVLVFSLPLLSVLDTVQASGLLDQYLLESSHLFCQL